jgi:hypothetical protein
MNKPILVAFIFLCFFLTVTQPAFAQDTTLADGILEKLQAIPGMQVGETKVDLMFSQPVDHNNPDAGTFKQQIHLIHKDYQKPVVLWLEGYESRGNSEQELTKLLDANQIIVEHRYFGKSLPKSIHWQYLTIKQAAADDHRIVQAFKDIYPGKWVNSGISKGGQTTMYHRRFYPDDVDASVCYVGPLNFSDKEPRIYNFLESVGDSRLDSAGQASCRQRILNFQRTVLKKKEDLLPMFKEYIKQKGYTYAMGADSAFEYTVLEYSFSFWQWHKFDCSEIPGSGSGDSVLIDHLMKGSDPYFISDQGIKKYRPFFYQALTQEGFYGYDPKPFSGLLEKVIDPDFRMTLPDSVHAVFDPKPMQDVNAWINKSGNNMIFIYGEIDPWSASAVQLSGETNAIKMVNPGGDHRTRISSFPDSMRTQILDSLESWLDVSILDENDK